MSQIVNVNDKTIKEEKELSRANAKMFMHENDLTIFNDTSLLRPLVPVPGPEFDIFKQTKFFVIRHEKALFMRNVLILLNLILNREDDL